MNKTRLAALTVSAVMAMAGVAEAAQCGNSAKGFDGFLKVIAQEAAQQGIGKRGTSRR